MKKYEVVRDCVIGGKTCHVGDIVELNEEIAAGLKAMSRIVDAKDAPKKKADRSVGLNDKVSTRKAKEEPVEAPEEPKEAE